MKKYLRASSISDILDFEIYDGDNSFDPYVYSRIAVNSLSEDIQSYLTWMARHECTRVNVYGENNSVAFDDGRYENRRTIPEDLDSDEWTWIYLDLHGNILKGSGCACGVTRDVPDNIKRDLPWATKVTYISDYSLPLFEIVNAPDNISLDRINKTKFASFVPKIFNVAMSFKSKATVDYYDLFD